MDNIRFGSVQRIRVMSNILGRMECLECQSIEEFALSKKTTYRLQSPASLALQILWDSFKLWDFILTEVYVFLEILDSPVEFFASTVLEHLHQARINVLPHTFFFRSVFKRGNRFTNSVVKSNLRNELTSLSVNWVFKARMVSFLNTITFRKNPLAKAIHIWKLSWEPWYLSGSNRSDIMSDLAQLNHCFAHIMLLEGTSKIDEEFHVAHVSVDHFGWSRLDPCHIDIVLGKYTKCLVKYTGFILEDQTNWDTVLGFPKIEAVVRILDSMWHTTHGVITAKKLELSNLIKAVHISLS